MSYKKINMHMDILAIILSKFKNKSNAKLYRAMNGGPQDRMPQENLYVEDQPLCGG
jgi:hypothetical protein